MSNEIRAQIEADSGAARLLALAKRLSKQALEPVAHDGVAVRFADGNTEPRITAVIFRNIERNDPIAETPTPFVGQDGFELRVAHELLLFGKG